MEIIKVDDINGIEPSVYEVIFMDKLVFASENYEECWEYMHKYWDLYINLLLWS